ncbi:hypothetical protein [Bythopirellula polymerisocia]|uniref:Uncharacterized protein n=1 Tax=Bythopirellula polymerisocia TaxID=2528003 RepID=A0A5C6D2I2_9BACT|nr:hypothetical protein [Bythopirellula polymerisocia]TWU30335.1 hypothetical protein Pla144_11210 [Bythopirellula polymerisocia]
MLATLAQASPTADFAIRENLEDPATVDLVVHDILKLDDLLRFTPEQVAAEAELSSIKLAVVTSTASDAISAITALAAAAGVLFLSWGQLVSAGERLRTSFETIADLSPFELFRLLSAIP